MKPFISEYNNGNRGEVAQYRSSNCSDTANMWKSLLTVYFVCALTLASPVREKDEHSAESIHIIKPPVRCPEGMKPDANGRCRVVWERSVDGECPDGERPDEEGICREAEETSDCFGSECLQVKSLKKRDVDDREGQTETIKPLSKHRKVEALKQSKKRREAEDGRAAKQARSKHAFIMMLKKKKMQMMKPKPKPPPHHPPHHHPPHHQGSQEQPEEEEPEEEEPEEEQPEQPQALRLFFGDEACAEKENSTGGCQPDAEIVANAEPNKEFKEWQPEKSDSSESSSSSSSDSTGESESEGGSGESEDEVLEKAIKIKLMKLFRMKQRYGPALRRWLANQLKEYEDSFDD